MTEREHTTAKRAAAETLRMIEAGYRYDVAARAWVRAEGSIDMKALHAAKRRERLPKGLIVLMTSNGKSSEFSFADVASRDEFMARARRLGKMVEILT